MKKLVILFFLFLGGVCVEVGTTNVYATDMDSKSSISFSETFVYKPPIEGENSNGVTPTGNPPGMGNQKFPQTGESNSNTFIQIGSILVVVASFNLKKYWKWELNNENN